jgi:hypothetical protein
VVVGIVDGFEESEGVKLGRLLTDGAVLTDGSADGIIEVEGVTLGLTDGSADGIIEVEGVTLGA